MERLHFGLEDFFMNTYLPWSTEMRRLHLAHISTVGQLELPEDAFLAPFFFSFFFLAFQPLDPFFREMNSWLPEIPTSFFSGTLNGFRFSSVQDIFFLPSRLVVQFSHAQTHETKFF